MNAREKKAYETAAHGAEDYVRKDDALILFRGALDRVEAEVILTQTLVQKELDLQEGRAAEKSETLLKDLQELLDLLRAIMRAEYTGDALEDVTLFGLTLDELQERSHHADEYYGVPTMTRPDYRYGEVYARLNLIRTELRQLESAGVRLFCEDTSAEGGSSDNAPAREDLLCILNRLSSAAHCLQCRWLGTES